MKLKMYFIMLALGLFSFAMQSCDDDDENAPVSEQLEKAFINEFGNVAHNWSTRGTNHVASFNQDNTEKEAWFDANGVWLMTETDIVYDDLPLIVKQGFEGLTQYEGWKRDDVDMLERKGMEKVYVIEIEKGKEELDLYFDVNGNLLKEVADKDDDSFNYLPSELPTAVAQLLNEKYAGYKLLEVEVDPVSKLLEVDVLLQSAQLEVCFDVTASYAWVSTSKDVLYTSLPDAVKTAAKNAEKEHTGYELDDEEAEKVVTPTGTYYIVELEMDGKPDIQVEIKEDGTLKQ